MRGAAHHCAPIVLRTGPCPGFQQSTSLGTVNDSDEGAAATDGVLARLSSERGVSDSRSRKNYVWTVILATGLLLFLFVLLAYGMWGLAVAELQCGCDAGPVGSILLVAGLIGLFGLTLGLSFVLLVRRRTSFYIPILGGIAMLIYVEAAVRMSGFNA